MPTPSPRVVSPSAASKFGQPPASMSAITLRHLRSAADIRSVLALRNGIDLSAHAGSPEFFALEKKETKSDSSAHSKCMASSPAPFAWCRWATGSR